MSIADLQRSLQAVEDSCQITARLLGEERDAVQQDRFGRRPSEMPKTLRNLYQTGTWRQHSVYHWPLVLEHSRIGHRLAANAEAELASVSYKQKSPMPEGDAIAEEAIKDSLAAKAACAPRMRKIFAARWAARHSRDRQLSRTYMQKRRFWVTLLDANEESRSPDVVEAAIVRDRELLVATRATSGLGGGMTNREVDLIFQEIETAGGTAGGYERWSRSITKIPNHNPEYLMPASDGGGVLMQNPLADHYAARNVNPWTAEERRMFLEKFVAHGKNFRKISAFFEHKSNEDVVRFYYDNKMRLGLKQLLKDSHLRKRGTRKLALTELAKLPTESRSIKDNFIHQPGFFSPDNQEEQEKENDRAEALSNGALGRSWTPLNRQSLIHALCRFDVSREGDKNGNAVSTVWESISAAVGNKTPKQCRHFYTKYKDVLGLGIYAPPTYQRFRRSPKRITPDSNSSTEEPNSRKHLKMSISAVKNGATAIPTAVGEYYTNGSNNNNGRSTNNGDGSNNRSV